MSDPLFRTVLVPERQSLFLPMGCSVGFHVGAVLMAVVARGALATALAFLPWCSTDTGPMITESLQVSVVSLPKSKNKMPDRAAREKRAQGTPTPKPVPPPPVKESDLVIHKDEPEPDPGNTSEELTRQELIDKVRREAALQDLMDAPEGPKTRTATDPNGTGDAEIAALGAQAMGDPAFARWKTQVAQALHRRFKPVGTPDGLLAVAQLRIDPETGKITSWDLTTESGNYTFDESARQAIQQVGALPPAPESYWPLLRAEYISVPFTPP